MGTTISEQKAGKLPLQQRSEIVNDLSIQVATVNGSGSQSSNNVLMRSIFQMGIPVSGKNLFPSNIAGLPTWFTIRASKHGYVGRKKEIDILVAMNPETAKEDVATLEPGRVVVYEQKLNLSALRDDLIFYPIPFAELAGEVVPDIRLRKLIANMIYVGSVAALLDIDMVQVESAIGKWFKSKQKAIDLNIKAAGLGAKYVREKLIKQDPFRVQPMNQTAGKIIIDGNSACALGSMFGGVSVVTWYPITPSSSLCETLMDYMKRFRIDPETGKATYAIVQAEDELAALGMALGAGWAGARSMTATAGPGISLMAEFSGLAYFAEIPAVVFDVQRIGPSTGLPTRTSQGDIMSLFYLSHGDTKHVVLFPADMNECFQFAVQAFDLAERLQQPIFVATDLDLGMNNWMSDPFPYPEKPLDRGKVLTTEEIEGLRGFARYKDVDGDAIPYRTLPGTNHALAAYFTRGSGHNEEAKYSERPEDYERLMDRLANKYETAKTYVPQPTIHHVDGAEVGIIAFGSTDAAMDECRHQLFTEYGIEAAYFRIRALPLTHHLGEFVGTHKRVYVVEQNRDGQMADLIKLEVGDEAGKIRKVRHYKGIPVDARFVTDKIVEMERGR
ncbi:MAG: 2-oxoacid:acceptor oxidoreductase subunit alpha [Acidobacteria bacterium]|nr:MAG: 2-oxoacid:acceptor oxidoreductase subunit alpha [Acidobacteriota bacterium]